MDENQNYGEANNHGVRSVFTIESGRVGFGKDGRDMLEYFKNKQAENPGFFYAVQLDDDNRLSNVFWADARSRVAYTHFGDVVMLETSYVVKRYRAPFALFTGVNHHGEPILLGCGLLVDDSESSFVWLLRTFLTAMGGCSPISFMTDGNQGLVAAVSQVFPKARHCVNKWRVLSEGQDKLTRACLADLYDCINLTETIEEFETSWASIIRKYDLSENDWVQSIYEVRRQWVPVYFRDSFFAACFLKQDTECSFFVGQVNEQTTLPVFFRQFERAMDYWFEKEIEADLEAVSNKPDLKTPSPMEKQVADLYTRKVFVKFQEELVETFVYTANRIGGDEDKCTYQIVKFDDERREYTVTLDMPNLRASCSCLMFEYTGVLCRHVLTVFAVTNVLTLPSHFILNRWTVNAKSVTKSNELGVNHAHESMSSRYNALCREAIRYAQEGALTSETYDTAVTALREARRTIDLVMKNAAKFAPQTPRVGIGYGDKRFFGAKTPLLWPPQDEAAHQFNLIDSTMNLIRMAPVSYCDDGSPDNMVVLPCLKSMTWVMELNNAVPANKIAVISLKLQDNRKSLKTESEVKFQLTRITLEPMLRSMAYIREQLSAPANKVAIINLKLQDTETITGESEVKFQVSRDTLGAMLRSMTYIREQLSISIDQQVAPLSKKQRK